MLTHVRSHWASHIDQIRRSGHYTWLGEGLAGQPTEMALTDILADIRHLCVREGLSFDSLVRNSREQFEHEESTIAV